MDSISLATNDSLPYFPVGLHTLDYNDGNKVIEKKPKERTSDYIIRLGKTRSDKRFCCVGTSCSFKLQIHEGELAEGEDNPYEQIALPRKIMGGSIILDVNDEKRTPILTYENQKFVLKSVELIQDTLFTWNQNEDIPKNTRDIYLHDGELHLHLETFNPGTPSNIVVVIGLKNNTSGRTLLPGALQIKPNTTTFKIEELFPEVMSFFTYDMSSGNTRVIVMENFVQMANFESVVQLIQESGSTLPPNIKQPLVRPLDVKKLAMYGFLKVNEEKRKGDYEDKVYYQDEKRIRYNPNIVESNRVKKAQEKIFFTIKIPPNFKLVRKDDIGPLQSFLHPFVFNGVYIAIMLLCGGVVYVQGIQYENFWTMVLFTIAFWLVTSIGFLIALSSGRGYYKKQLEALPINDPEREEKEQELNEKIDKMANPGTFVITIASVFVAWAIIYAVIGYFIGIGRTYFSQFTGETITEPETVTTATPVEAGEPRPEQPTTTPPGEAQAEAQEEPSSIPGETMTERVRRLKPQLERNKRVREQASAQRRQQVEQIKRDRLARARARAKARETRGQIPLQSTTQHPISEGLTPEDLTPEARR
jgi:hypothetical protein